MIDRFLHFDRLEHAGQWKGDRYWVLRFAGALHYLEDCGTPYHASPGSPVKFSRYPFCTGSSSRKISLSQNFTTDIWATDCGEATNLLEETEGLRAASSMDSKKWRRQLKSLHLLPEVELSVKRLIGGNSFQNPSQSCQRRLWQTRQFPGYRRLDEVSCKGTS